MTEEQQIEESLDETASKLIEQAERVADELYLAAEEARQRRLVARRRRKDSAQNGLAALLTAVEGRAVTDTETVRPMPLEGLPEAEAVMDYKVALLQAVKWVLEAYPEASEEVRMRTGMHFAELLGEDVWNALLALWAEQ